MRKAKIRANIPGSERKALLGAKVIGKVDPNKLIEITVLVRPRSVEGNFKAHTSAGEQAMSMALKLLEQRHSICREAFADQYGAAPDDLAKVKAFALEHHLTIIDASIPKRSVKLEGTIRNMTSAFQPNLKKSRIGDRVFRSRTGPISVPKHLKNIIVGVFGFDDRPAATPHCRFYDDATASPHNARDGSFTPLQVARRYNFPADLDGTGQCIGLIELNDFNQHNVIGTGFRVNDLHTYFNSLELAMPQVTAVGVDGGANLPGHYLPGDGEVMLDIGMAGAAAPRASIVVYFAPNNVKGILEAVSAALHDKIHKPSVISISFGSPEKTWTKQFLNALNQHLQDAKHLGVTVCCSAGDFGSSDIEDPKEWDGRPHVDFPASSPFVLACGGTMLNASGKRITSEIVWNQVKRATGGGVSNFFPMPIYQAKAKVPKSPKGKSGRGVPDVAGIAGGYWVVVNGHRIFGGGTSAVAPLWAGLIALVNQRLVGLGKPTAGFINPLLYNTTADVFHDIVDGKNDIEGLGKYAAGIGWNACTGLGTPDGTKLLSALGG